MDRKIYISNKIVCVDQIIEVAEYLENKKLYYTQLILEDEKKNEMLPYSERKYHYKGKVPKNVEYELCYTDGTKNTLTDFQSFVFELKKPQYISEINMYFFVYYNDEFNTIDNNSEVRNVHVFINISDTGYSNNRVSIRIMGDNLTDDMYKMETDIRTLFEKNDDRTSGVVKYRKLIKLCFCLSIGFIISYILILILLLSENSFDSIKEAIFNDAFSFLLFQWFISILFGTAFGLIFINSLYNTLAPPKKYSGYDKNIHMAVYRDDDTEFKDSNEVHIGKCANNGEKRVFLGQIFNVTKVFILVQLVVSFVLFIIMPK